MLFSAHTASRNEDTELLNKVIEDPKKTFNYQKNLITDNENLLINLLCKNGIMKFNYEPLGDHGRLKIFFKWILPMSWEFKHLDKGPFIRRPHLMKYRFFLRSKYTAVIGLFEIHFSKQINLSLKCNDISGVTTFASPPLLINRILSSPLKAPSRVPL